MKTLWVCGIAALLIGVCFNGLADDRVDQATTQTERSPLGEETAIYLGVGNVQGPGRIVQVGSSGEVLGSIKTESTPYALSATQDFVFAVLPSAGKVVRVFRNGHVTDLQSTGGITHPIAIATHLGTDQIFIGDNSVDRIVRISPGQIKDNILEIDEPDNSWQSLSIAAISGDQIVFSSSSPRGVFLSDFRKQKLGPPLLPDQGDVAADPTSKRWVATQETGITLFEGDKQVRTISLPDEMQLYRTGLPTFSPDGKLFIAVQGGRGVRIMHVDRQQGTFHKVCDWRGERIVALSVSRRMSWKFEEDEFGDTVEVIAFDPPLPAILKPGERLKVKVSYRLNSAETANIFVRPMTDGRTTPGYSAHGSPSYSRGTGTTEGWFLFRRPTVVDQVRVSLVTSVNGQAHRLERYFAAPAGWADDGPKDDPHERR